MEAVQLIYYVMPPFVGFLGLVAWIVRLDAKVRALEENYARLDGKHNEITERLVKELSEVQQALARIEGKIEAHWERK